MAYWGPVVVAVELFPGLIFQLPGRNRVVDFGNMHTSGSSILVHTIIYFGLITIFLIAIQEDPLIECSVLLLSLILLYCLLILLIYIYQQPNPNIMHIAGEDLSALGMKELKQLERQLRIGVERVRSKKRRIISEHINQLKRRQRALQEESTLLQKKLHGLDEAADIGNSRI